MAVFLDIDHVLVHFSHVISLHSYISVPVSNAVNLQAISLGNILWQAQSGSWLPR